MSLRQRSMLLLQIPTDVMRQAAGEFLSGEPEAEEEWTNSELRQSSNIHGLSLGRSYLKTLLDLDVLLLAEP